ncbi:UNVERIFIED_CONTAM: clcA [Trichonephila clavipes]
MGHRIILLCNVVMNNNQRVALLSNKIVHQVPYANKSAVHVQEDFSLHRAYIIFRSLGLRHLVVVNEKNDVVGIITRKDLMGYNIEEKLLKILNQSDSFISQEMTFVTQ